MWSDIGGMVSFIFAFGSVVVGLTAGADLDLSLVSKVFKRKLTKSVPPLFDLTNRPLQ